MKRVFESPARNVDKGADRDPILKKGKNNTKTRRINHKKKKKKMLTTGMITCFSIGGRTLKVGSNRNRRVRQKKVTILWEKKEK